jgi:hypothetical protein
MNQAVKLNETDWIDKAGGADNRTEAGRPSASFDRRARLLRSATRSLRRVSSLLWILALLCFILAAFVWWELLHV